MRCLLVGLMMSLLACGWAVAQDAPADMGQSGVEAAVVAAPAEPAGQSEVTGISLYQGPQYETLDSTAADITVAPEFHSFQQRPVAEVGFSPLTLADFRYPVVKRTAKEFSFERLYYPDHSLVSWHDDCAGYTVTAFFFTRDMVRDHIQRLVDEYYICEPDLLQQVIDYYAEVTPQCGEAISWVWFAVDKKNHNYSDQLENPFFTKYLYNFEDKFYLEFGLPKVQDKVDEDVREFLYQYRDRGRFACGPEFKERPCPSCDKCADKKNCDKGCDKVTPCGECVNQGEPCPSKKCYECNECREKGSRASDEGLYCTDYDYHGFDLNLNAHYLYYPRKVVIEDMVYDPLAQAYRWKFAWRFNDCELDWLKQMCQYGEKFQFALVLSDPHWYGYAPLDHNLKRDILASMDPSTWGNVWPAGNLPYDMTCCECQMPNCDGNCTPVVPVGWGYVEPAPAPEPALETPPAAEPPQEDFNYFPPPDEKHEVISVPGKG